MGSLLQRVSAAFSALRGASAPAKRDYLGARLGRGLTFITGLQRQDQQIRKDIMQLRAHSRHLDQNNPYMRAFLRIMETQVVGPKGFTLQSRLRTKAGASFEPYNTNLENAFARWAQRGTCTVDGKNSFLAASRMVSRSLALDGEVFIREVVGADNAFGYGLQFIDPDLLDHTFNREPSQGYNAIVMGVELDRFGKPVAYHFTDTSVAWRQSYPWGGSKIRIPASEIIHIFDPERCNQTRGVPHAAPVMYLMAMLGSTWESEVAAARYEAERVAVLQSKTGELTDGTAVDPRSAMAQLNGIQSSAIHVEALPPGVEMVPLQMNHPNGAMPEFSKAMLKGLATGLGVSYSAFTGDLSDSTYSGGRQGLLIERDNHRKLQGLLIEAFCERVFRGWIRAAWMSNAIQLPPGVTLDQASAHRWSPRGWDWVDPLKDAQADVLAINNGLATRTEILAERGVDFEDVVRELSNEQKALQAAGIWLAPVGGAVTVMKEEPDASASPDGASDTSTKKGAKSHAA